MSDGGVLDPALIDPSLDSRAVNFENPTGARGSGGSAHGGRKGAPNRTVAAGERVTLADLDGPGTLRHLWMTFMPGPPEAMRAVWMEVTYDGAAEPSISVPVLDFFGMPHGRPLPYESALLSCQEGRGFNAYLPMPFSEGVRVELTNSGDRPVVLYYQIDYTAERRPPEHRGYLHVSFRRENPTVQGRDFVIARGVAGPGRFLGCNVGVRVVDECDWYGEGEVKIYRDGDRRLPTICGTGLEDYVGTAWGLGPHAARYGGSPLVVAEPQPDGTPARVPDFVGFYRWHLPDPVMFSAELTVTIQQIGAAFFGVGQEDKMAAYARTNPVAGPGYWHHPAPGILAWTLAERVDDFCATAYVYASTPQPVPPLDVDAAVADIARRPYEAPHPMERFAAAIVPPP